MKPEEMAEAVRLWRTGDPGLNQYLTDHGITHITKWKNNQKARYGKAEPVATVKVDGPLRIETPEVNKVEVIEAPAGVPVPPPFEYKVTGIDTAVGTFQYFKHNQYLDWTDLNGETVSMTLEEWKEFMKLWPFVLKTLGVEL